MYKLELCGHTTAGYYFTMTLDDLERDEALRLIRSIAEDPDEGDYHFESWDVFRWDAQDGWVCETKEMEEENDHA